MVALACSTLLSDALLHLIPQALGIGHDHSTDAEDDHDHKDGETALFTNTTLKGCVALASIYAFYLIEMMLDVRQRVNTGEEPPCDFGHTHGGEVVAEVESVAVSCQGSDSSGECKKNHNAVTKMADGMLLFHIKISQKSNFFISFSELLPKKSYGWMLILGDVIHNFVDGLAIGATFSNSVVQGIATSLAVLCHEIPHELGDFAALIKSGMSWRGSLLWNILQTIPAFVGLYIGLSLAADAEAQRWVYAFTLGIFIYVALGDLLGELRLITEHFWTMFLLQNLGIHIGFWAMFLLAIYEEALIKAVK